MEVVQMEKIQPPSSSLRIVTDASAYRSASYSDVLHRSSNQKHDPQVDTKDNEESTFSINMSGGKSDTVESPYKAGRIGGEELADRETMITATSTKDVDSCVDSFAALCLHSGAPSSKLKATGIRILSASHTSCTSSGNSEEESDDCLDMRQSVELEDLSDEDEMYPREMRLREQMRWSKVKRYHDEEGDSEDDTYEVDYGDDETDDSDDSEDVEDAEDFEDAQEVRRKTYPKGFKIEVSMFGTMFMALDGWISATALAHIYGKDPQEEDIFLHLRGNEYYRQPVIGNDVSAKALRSKCSRRVWQTLPEVVRALSIPVPMSTLEPAIGRLVKTMSFVGAWPPLGEKQWHVVVLLLLDGLSVHRLPCLESHFLNNPASFSKVLESTGTREEEYNIFRDLLLPLGRLPA